MAERVVIVGGSHAGIGTADWLRRTGFAGEIVVTTEEELFQPYQRPPLSKDADLPEEPGERFVLRKPDFYTAHDIALRLGTRVCSIDRSGQCVRLADGSDLAYSHLVLATGAQARQLPAGMITGGVPLLMRRYRDATTLRRHLASARSLVIVGGGLIGLEVAALAGSLGSHVTLIEAAPRLLGRVAPPVIAERVQAFHTCHGVDIRLGEALTALSCGPAGWDVTLASGEAVRADHALVAIGTEPRVDLAGAAGLAIDNGVVVSACGQTSDRHIWAVGDCCNWLIDTEGGQRRRFEGIQPATEQGKIVAHDIAGKASTPLPVPRFWSHQGNLRLQMSGVPSERADYVALATASVESMCVLAVEDGAVVACFALNAPDEFRAATRLVETRALLAEWQVPERPMV